MKRSLFTKWIAELRDPTATQCHSVLKRLDGARCCLGVFLDVAGLPPSGKQLISENGKDLDVYTWSDIYADEGIDTEDTVVGTLPKQVVDDYGFHDPEGHAFSGHGGLEREKPALITLNDGGSLNDTAIEPHTFSEIADILEKNPTLYVRIEED